MGRHAAARWGQQQQRGGRKEGVGPILRVSHNPSRLALGSTTVLTLVDPHLLLLLGRDGNNGERGGRDGGQWRGDGEVKSEGGRGGGLEKVVCPASQGRLHQTS